MINGYKINIKKVVLDDCRRNKYPKIPINLLQKILIALIREIRKIKDISDIEKVFSLVIDGSHYSIATTEYSIDPLIYEFY